MTTEIPFTHYRTILERRRKELVLEMEDIEDKLDDMPSADTAERATEREGDEVLEIQGNLDIKEVRAIDAALKRIEDGSYGTCASCGGAISKERLDAVPHAALCRNCMAK